MKTTLINEICGQMNQHLTEEQNRLLQDTLQRVFRQFDIPDNSLDLSQHTRETNTRLLNLFIASKKIEGCSENTLHYYSSTLSNMLNTIQKNACTIETDDIRFYLATYQDMRNSSKVTMDNIRRIMSSFFTWLEDEDYIGKSPVRRIHKVKVTQFIKETLTDENLESLRDQCRHPRDLAIIDLLISTGIRVGELVNLNRSDINFDERECVVLGKGDKERKVYFDARTKIHLLQYLDGRCDTNSALFVGLYSPCVEPSLHRRRRTLSLQTRGCFPCTACTSAQIPQDHGYYGDRKRNADRTAAETARPYTDRYDTALCNSQRKKCKIHRSIQHCTMR